MFKKSLRKKVFGKIVAVGQVSILLFILVAYFVYPVNALADFCNPSDPKYKDKYSVYFDVQSPGTGVHMTELPIDGEVVLYLQVNYPRECSRPVFTNDGGKFYVNTTKGPVLIAGAPRVENDIIVKDNYAHRTEFWLQWQVKGLTAVNSDKPGVQVRDEVEFKAQAYLSDGSYKEASLIKLPVVTGTNVPPKGGDGGGGGGTGGDNQVSTPIVGRVDSPISIGSLGELITTAIKYLLGFLATLSVLFIIIGGVRMVVSGGSEGEVKAGKQTVTWAVIGMVVSLLAFTIVNIVQSLLKVK